MRTIIIKYLESRPILRYNILLLLNKIKPIRGKGNTVRRCGCLIHCKFSIVGNHNEIIIGKGSIISNTFFHIRGNHNKIVIGENCKTYEDCSLWIDGDNNIITIGEKTTIRSAHLCAQEGTSIKIGKECMLSNSIEIRTSDSHSIYSNQTKKRLNPSRSLVIKNHVWIAAKAVIMKGVTIGSGSVVGYGSMVTKDVGDNVVVAGRPAKIIYENVSWFRSVNEGYKD